MTHANPQCSECHFWKLIFWNSAGDFGQCRRHSPVAQKDRSPGISALYPQNNTKGRNSLPGREVGHRRKILSNCGEVGHEPR